jgi:hypothetical protein
MLALVILSILFTWLVCAAVCIGIGSLLLRVLCAPPPRVVIPSAARDLLPALSGTGQENSSLPTVQLFSLLDSFWTGVALIAAILQLYHFLRPIDSVIVYLFFALALAGLLWNRSFLFQYFSAGAPPVPTRSGSFAQQRVGSSFQTFQRSDVSTSRRANVLLFLLAAVIIAFRSAAPTEHYDTGLYGAQAIRWFTTYPLLPGLGNVIGQLGFNSSIFLWIAALDQGPWRNFAHHLFVGFLIAALFASILPAALRIFRGKDVSSTDWFFTLLFIPAAIAAAMGKLSGANTDLPTTIICLVAAGMLFRALDSQTRESMRESAGAPSFAQQRGGSSIQLSLVIAMLLFSLVVTFKISSLVFALSGWLVSFLALSFSHASRLRKRLITAAVLISAAIVLPWIARGLILTGYPFFPSTALSIPVDWTVPAANAQVQADFARSFARIPQIPLADTQGFRWLRPWFHELIREREGFLIPFFFALAGIVVAIFRISRAGRTTLPRWLWLLLPSLAGLVFWFVEAPAIRFGEPILWAAAATLGTFAALPLFDQPIKKRFVILALLLMTAWAAHPRLLWNSYFRPSVSVQTILRLPQARVVPHRTSSGLTVYVPVETNQCWDAPLPCSPYFNDTLRLRRPGDMKGGFISESPIPDVKVP